MKRSDPDRGLERVGRYERERGGGRERQNFSYEYCNVHMFLVHYNLCHVE